MNPMIKYIGGKSREIIHFINNMPKEYSRYIESFFVEALCFSIFSQKNLLLMTLITGYISIRQMQTIL